MRSIDAISRALNEEVAIRQEKMSRLTEKMVELETAFSVQLAYIERERDEARRKVRLVPLTM